MPVEGSGLSSRATHDAARGRRLGNLSTPDSVQKLQAAFMHLIDPKKYANPHSWCPTCIRAMLYLRTWNL
jgi:hypothetical protein